jgi:hypothetical protein
MKTVSQTEFEAHLAKHITAIPDGFSLQGSMIQTKWIEHGVEVARRSDDGFGTIYEILEPQTQGVQ